MIQQKKIFPNNRIVESLCQLTFTEQHPNGLSDGLTKSINEIGVYSTCELIPSIQFIFKVPDIQLNPNSFTGLKFTNADGDKVIQLHNDNFSIHQLGKYREWSSFRDDIVKGIKAFVSINPGATISRIDLRFINAFEFPVGSKPDEYFKVGVFYKGGIINSKQYNLTVEEPIGNKPGRYVVTRLSHSINKEKENVSLDLSFVYLCEENLRIEEFDKILSELDEGNSELYSLFSSSITDKLKAFII